MLPVGDTYLQLLGPTGPDTTVGKFVAKRGEGLHHIAYEVEDLEGALAELKAKGISIERTTTSDYVKTATVTDPAGNRVVFAELAAQP